MKNKLKSLSYIRIVCIYIVLCAIVIVTGLTFTRNINLNYNLDEMETTAKLVAEKSNDALEHLVSYAKSYSTLASNQDYTFEEMSTRLQRYISVSPYSSIGVIDMEGHIYGSDGDKTDLTKYGYQYNIISITELTVSRAYMSSVLGQNIFAIFNPVYQGEEIVAILYATVPLEAIQDAMECDELEDRYGIYLMNGFSGNYMFCHGEYTNSAGLWTNIRLQKDEIEFDEGYSYDAWRSSMQNGDEGGVTCYRINDVEYTMSYQNVKMMDGWYLIIAVENTYLGAITTQYRLFNAVFISIIIIITIVLSYILYNKETKEKDAFRYLSTIDVMTGVNNKREFEILFNQMIHSRKEHGALIFLDIDDFKAINDHYGHQKGDTVIKEFAVLLSKQLNENDLIGRFGGDEFIIYLSRVDQDKMVCFLQDVQDEIKNSTFEVPYTFSAGIALYPKDGLDYQVLCENADHALYYAKNHGKQQIHFYNPDDE